MAAAEPSTPETPTGAFIQRHPDGRHAVMDQTGRLVGLHNSHQSALRQIGDYYGAPHRPAPAEMEAAPQDQAQEPQAAAPAHGLTPTPMPPVNVGAALIHAHPHANPDQLIAFAHQMGQAQAGQTPLGAFGAEPAQGGGATALQGKLQGQQQLQGQLQSQTEMGAPVPLGPLTRRII
jgi:hypothetical protein